MDGGASVPGQALATTIVLSYKNERCFLSIDILHLFDRFITPCVCAEW